MIKKKLWSEESDFSDYTEDEEENKEEEDEEENEDEEEENEDEEEEINACISQEDRSFIRIIEEENNN